MGAAAARCRAGRGALAWAPAASTGDLTITSFDGTKIAAHWFPGKGVSASSPAPTILEGPGWSQPGDSAPVSSALPLTLDGATHSISHDLEMVAGRAPAGGGYTLQLTASSSLYDLQRSAGAATFDSIAATMPLGDPVAAPQPAAKHKKKQKHRKRRHRH